MKILWLTNIIPSIVSNSLGIEGAVSGGWISGALESILKNNIEICLVFPQYIEKRLIRGNVGNIEYFGFPQSRKSEYKYDISLIKLFEEILVAASPDLVHIWGTEFSHSLAMVKAFNNPQKTVCSIQGLCTPIATNYRFDLPNSVYYGWTIRDILRFDNTYIRNCKFAQRGKTEQEIIKNISNVIGRTEFDKSYTASYNQDVRYFHCDETLRSAFYKSVCKWNYDLCNKHSIFVTSGSYPLKGLHKLLEAFSLVLKRYPDARVYITANDPNELPFYRKLGYYKYLGRLRKKFGLGDKIQYVGFLNADAMVERFLSSNVFVSTSSIENSPNSVGEAMLLGVPVVASFAGGTMDMLEDKKEGFLYQHNDSVMLAHYICKVFEMEKTAEEMGRSASRHASVTHDIEKNENELLKIYKDILS